MSKKNSILIPIGLGMIGFLGYFFFAKTKEKKKFDMDEINKLIEQCIKYMESNELLKYKNTFSGLLDYDWLIKNFFLRFLFQ